MTVTQKTRGEVYRRDAGCIVQGVTQRFGSCFGPRTVQHTVGKGMGGSKLFDTTDLLIEMCNRHNVLLTTDADFQAFGKARGWVRDRNAKRDPRLTPVLYSDGWFRLEGSVRVPMQTPQALDLIKSITGLLVF